MYLEFYSCSSLVIGLYILLVIIGSSW
ncbi:MAG: YjcZ family sporulation protein [Nitrosopumilus sp.]|nr:YjcZ family sporulation protein [Nitrosopumilus sp.]